jgi:hypothetical protein
VSNTTSQVARRAVLCVCTASWLLVAVRSAPARQIGLPNANPPAKDLSPGESDVLLRDRNRDTMHSGLPLVVVGREQGGNDLRSRTPALAQADHQAAIVNPDDIYRRTLAMYEDGAAFHVPPVAASVSADVLKTQRRVARAGRNAALVPASSRWPWILAATVVALALAWTLKHAGSLRVVRAANAPGKRPAARR